MSEASRCWHCNGSLMQFGRIHFAMMQLQDGNTVRVHKCCLDAAWESTRRLTAQPPERRILPNQGDEL